jgi:hypothetical protein
LDAARETLPADNPALLNIETAYANTLTTLHQSAEAEPLLRHVIAAQTKALGPDHKHTLLSKPGAGRGPLDQHRDEEAAATALPAARALDALLGADNLYAMSAWNFYGSAACASHQEEQGLAALKRVAAARQRLYPPGTWVIYSSQLGIGVCQFHMRHYGESEATLLAAVRASKPRADPDSIELRTAIARCAICTPRWAKPMMPPAGTQSSRTSCCLRCAIPSRT